MLAGGRIFIGRRLAYDARNDRFLLALGFSYLETLATRTLLFTVGFGEASDPRLKARSPD
jgi:hypothetical protein